MSLAKEETALVPADPPGPPARHLVCTYWIYPAGGSHLQLKFFGPIETRVGEWIEVAEVPMEAPEQGMPQEMTLAIHRIFLDFAQTLHDDHK